MAVAAGWRRHYPLLFLAVVGGLAAALSGGLTSLDRSTITGLYTLAVPLFTVAVWEPRTRATLGLALWAAGASGLAVVHRAGAGATRRRPGDGRRRLGSGTRVARAAAPERRPHRDDGAAGSRTRSTRQLAVATERTRIARDLHGPVAHGVITMVVQAEAARKLLVHEPVEVEAAIRDIEQTGRDALTQLRRILGVLRSPTDPPTATAIHTAGTPAASRVAAPATGSRAGADMTVRVVIADDQQLVRAGFAMILSTYSDIEVVAEATNGHEAVTLADVTRARRRPHGHPDAGHQRHRGNPPHHPTTARTGADPHHLRPRRVRLRGAARGRHRLPAQGHAARTARRGGTDRAPGRRAACPLGHPSAHRGVHPAAPPEPSDAPQLDQLSPREAEVFRLLARGLTNHEIAEQLVVGENTVKTHVARILTKLDLRDRVQAVVLAYETGLVTPAMRPEHGC